jgi:hypothetical protein
MRLAYDPDTGRVSDQWDALDHHTVFAWDPATERATMTDPRGGTWVAAPTPPAVPPGTATTASCD